MMAQEKRVLAMVQAGTITEDEGERLRAALRARRQELPWWAVLLKPMDLLSTPASWAVAGIVTATSILVSRLGVRFDGALDLHRVAGTPPWGLVLFDAANAVLLTGAVLWIVSLAAARQVRAIDFLVSVAIARVAQVGGGLAACVAIPDPAAMQRAMVSAMTEGTPPDPWLVLPTFAVVPFLVWFVALLYQGFRTSSGLVGAKAGFVFTVAILTAELASKVALFAATGWLMATAVYAQASTTPAGTWNGAIETPVVRLAIVVRLREEKGAWNGTIDIPQQGAKGVALVDVVIDPPTVSFRIPGAPGDPTIRVTMSEDGARMSGALTQGGGTVPVTLTRAGMAVAAAAPRRPQTPSRPLPYREEEVAFRNDAADVRLAGTLTLPAAGGRFPAVLLITGSGPQDRDETIDGHKPFFVLADHLTRQGIAVLRVDDRGVGGSSRGPDGITSNDLVGDVRAGVTFLQQRPDIDPKRIGLIGHSEGAMLAAMLAASAPDVSFVVMLAGPGLPGDQILLAQAGMLFKAAGASDAVIAWDRSVRERVFTVVKAETDGRPNSALRQALLEELGTAPPASPGAPDGAAARKLAETLFAASSNTWLRFFLAYDPRPTLAKVRVPVLALGGERDLQVAARENLAEIERAVKAGGNADVTTVLLPDLNHRLQTSATGTPAEYATIEETLAPAVLTMLAEWILKRV